MEDNKNLFLLARKKEERPPFQGCLLPDEYEASSDSTVQLA